MMQPKPQQQTPPLDSIPSLRAVTITSEPAPVFGQRSLPESYRTSGPRRRGPVAVTARPLDFSNIDWALVYRIRLTVSQRLSDETGQQLADSLIDEATRIQIGRDMIAHIVKQHSDDAILAGDRLNQIAAVDLERYRRAVDCSIFGYGRWQPLLEDPHVENIEILGHDRVFMVYGDRIERVAPVADSDAELIEQLQFISAYSKTPKPFSEAHPEMTLNLEDRFRLHAVGFAEIVDRPSIVIRQHTFAGVALQELCSSGMMPTKVFEFLSAAVKAKQSIVISGIGGAGKTTFLRALAMEMDPLEAVAVVETDAELFLHKLLGRDRVRNFTAREASGEGVTPDGRPIGEFTVQRHLMATLRQNISRIIVGEVRGSEAAAMFQAMQVGAGSLSTIHAQHAAATIERLVTAAALGGVMTQIDAYRQIAVNIDLIVHLGTEDRRSDGGKLRRYVNQITEISGFRDSADGNGTTYMPATDLLYQAGAPEQPLDVRMSDEMRQALYAQGWRP